MIDDLVELADLIREGWGRVSGRWPTEESARRAAEFAAATYPLDTSRVLEACREFQAAGGLEREDRCSRALGTLLLLLEEQGVPFDES